MSANLTLKRYSITLSNYVFIQRYFDKLRRLLPHLGTDISKLNIFVRRHPSKYFAKKHHHHSYTNFTDRKLTLALYEGYINWRLPMKTLFIQFKGQSFEECLHTGMDRLIKELKKYKSRYFRSQSEYSNHDSIRKIINYE